jgi:importin subunit beta-1
MQEKIILFHTYYHLFNNIESDKWNFKEASIMAYGAILDGPDRSKLTPLVKQTLPLILKQMQDTNPLVKDTTAWTLGRVCQFVPEALDSAMLGQLMFACINALGEQTRVAQKICYALHSLALAVTIHENTSPLSQYLQDLLRALLNAANRPDVAEGGLLLDIFEVINDLVRTAAPDMYNLIAQLIPELQNRLQKTLQTQPKDADVLLASLCSTLSEIIRKLNKDVIVPQADTLMTYLVHVLHSKNAGTLAETLIAIGDVANRVGPDFKKYVPAVKDILLASLAATNELNLCIVATGLVGDISRAIGEDFFTIGDEVMKALLENLSQRMIDRALKPHIISAFADIALSLKGLFDRYNAAVMNMLHQAAQTTYNEPDDDSIDFLQNLRQSILEAYTGILTGLSDGNKKQLFVSPGSDVNVIQGLLEFFDRLEKDRDYLNDGILNTAAGLIGDLANDFGPEAVKVFAVRPSVKFLIQQAGASRDHSTKEAALWAQSKLR